MTRRPRDAYSLNALIGTDVRVKIVDIGANPIDGAPPYATLLQAGDAEIIGFEPNPKALAALNAGKGPWETYLPLAIADGRRHTLHVCRAPGMTSLLKPNHAVLRHFHGFPLWGEVLETVVVSTTRLDDVPETAGAHLLKLDIQGAELLALRNAPLRLKDALVVQAEVEFLRLYVDQPLFGDVDAHLRDTGFVFHRFFPLVSRMVCPMIINEDLYGGLSQALWADAIFVRDFTKPDALSDGDLLGMAMILHDCYQSFDLALAMLTEHDRRCRTTLGATYLAGLRGPEARQAA